MDGVQGSGARVQGPDDSELPLKSLGPPPLPPVMVVVTVLVQVVVLPLGFTGLGVKI